LAHHPKDGFVDRLHSLRFLRECDPSYRVLTLALVGLPPTEYASLKLDTHRKPDFTGVTPARVNWVTKSRWFMPNRPEAVMIWHFLKRLLIFPKGLLGGLIAATL